jgi:hypothetical protein
MAGVGTVEENAKSAGGERRGSAHSSSPILFSNSREKLVLKGNKEMVT